MKRMKSILGVLILSIGILGTGYAYWCDTLTANATVTTGDFDVDFGELTATDYCTGTDATAVLADDDCITINTGVMRPGSWAFFNIPFENNGMDRAILNSVDYSGCDKDCPREIDYFVGMNGHWYRWEVSSAYKLDDVIEYMFDRMYYKGVKEGTTMSVQIMPIFENKKECQDGQNMECTFQLDFNWMQGNCAIGCDPGHNGQRALGQDVGLELLTQAQFEAAIVDMGTLPVSELNEKAIAE